MRFSDLRKESKRTLHELRKLHGIIPCNPIDTIGKVELEQKRETLGSGQLGGITSNQIRMYLEGVRRSSERE